MVYGTPLERSDLETLEGPHRHFWCPVSSSRRKLNLDTAIWKNHEKLGLMTSFSPVSLRPFHHTDETFFAAMASDERVTRFVGDGTPWSAEAVDARIREALRMVPVKQPGSVRWFTAESASGQVGLLVSTRKTDSVEIGYWVDPEHWGKGIAGTILDQTVTLIPEAFGVSTLTAKVSADNVASIRALNRHGFRLLSQEDGLDQYIWTN